MSKNGVFFDEKIFDVVMLAGKWPESIDVTSPHQKYPKDVPKCFLARPLHGLGVKPEKCVLTAETNSERV